MNEFQITTDEYNVGRPLQDYSVFESKGTSVYFRNLVSHLSKYIEDADIVVGCIAWLTHPAILELLATKQGVSIIVQKEDFLRPDSGASGDWKTNLHRLYSQLPSNLTRLDNGFAGTALHLMSCATDPDISAVRCVGIRNSEKKMASPRAHHKFLIFCKKTDDTEECWGNFSPYAVWTGSFNITKNAVASLENAIVLRDEELVAAYFKEYAQITALSEPLDWSSEWSEPEWRIGT